MGSMAIQDGGVSVLDGTRVIQNDNLSKERFSGSGGVSLGVRGNISSFDFFNSDVFNVETNVVSWNSFSKLLVMHFDGFNSGGFVRGGEVDIHVGFKNTSFNSSDGDCSNTSNFVDILKRKSEGFFGGSLGGNNLIESLEKSRSGIPRGIG